MLILKILLALLTLYVVFLLGPAVAATLTVFARGTDVSLESALRSPHFAPCAARLRACAEALAQRPHRRVRLKAPDGAALCGDYYELGSRGTVIFAHGYRATPAFNFAAQAEAFAARGWNLLLIQQRAHGESGGKRCYLGLKEQYDLLAWADWAAAQPGVRELVLYGMSMGAAAAAYASDKLDPVRVRALVLDCGYRSPYLQMSQDCRQRRLPTSLLMPLVRLLARLFYDIDIAEPVTGPLSRTGIPAFFLHGTADQTVPYRQGLENYEACASEKSFFTAPEARHIQAFLTEGEGAEAALFAFLSAHTDTTGTLQSEQK